MLPFARYNVLLTLIILNITISFAQKPILDTTIFNNWPHVSDPHISNDGNYFIYTIHNQTKGCICTVIKDMRNSKEHRLPDINSSAVRISNNSTKAFILHKKNLLQQLDLNKKSSTYNANVEEFNLFIKGDSEYLIYLQKDSISRPSLRMINLDSGKEICFTEVYKYYLSNNGRLLSLERGKIIDGKETSTLSIVKVGLIKEDTIYQGDKINGEVIFDKLSQQLAFTTLTTDNNRAMRTIWYYKIGAPKARQLTSDKIVACDSIQLGLLLFFNKKQDHIYCWAKKRHLLPNVVKDIKPDVWHYKDSKLQTQQVEYPDPNYRVCLIPISDSQVKQVSRDNESVTFDEYINAKEERLIITTRKGDISENYWNADAKATSHILYGNGLNRRELINNSYWIILSPAGNFLCEYDPEMKDLYSFELQNGVLRNLTKSLPIPLSDSTQDTPNMKHFRGIIVSGWLANDAGVLLYDGFDIWNVDLKGKRLPVCLTNGYGRRNNITFNFAINYEKTLLTGHELVTLTAFNNNTKESGFYALQLDQPSDPQIINMGPYTYEWVNGTGIIIKAKNKNLYIVSQGSTKSSYNFYSTKDFKTFTALTDIHPESKWNWLSCELVNWQGEDGQKLQGVLYKPENFDAQKKYPIIFHYYETLSNNLNRYHQPEATNGPLNIPWFTSHGYLVFTPDIHFKIGHPGASSLNILESAAKYLSKFPWIDSTCMGLQGHSWSGYQTAYIVTHSQLFAAASEGAGPTNFISSSGSIIQGGIDARFFPENNQSRIGATLWERPDLYEVNSPIFQAYKVSTPLLIMHCKNDALVTFGQGLEFFNALRRIGKTVWMLQYDSGDHRLGRDDAIDFTRRLSEFYDHYLKHKPTPTWMNPELTHK